MWHPLQGEKCYVQLSTLHQPPSCQCDVSPLPHPDPLSKVFIKALCRHVPYYLCVQCPQQSIQQLPLPHLSLKGHTQHLSSLYLHQLPVFGIHKGAWSSCHHNICSHYLCVVSTKAHIAAAIIISAPVTYVVSTRGHIISVTPPSASITCVQCSQGGFEQLPFLYV